VQQLGKEPSSSRDHEVTDYELYRGVARSDGVRGLLGYLGAQGLLLAARPKRRCDHSRCGGRVQPVLVCKLLV
jgi:hypothetical protein